MSRTKTRITRRWFTYALAWRDEPPPTLLPHVASVGCTFLYTSKSFMAWGAAYQTALDSGGFLDKNEWPIGIAPRWLQDHACLTDLFDRLVGAGSRSNIVYAPVFDPEQDIILAVLWNRSERVSPPAPLRGVTNLSAPNVNFPLGMATSLAAHTAQPAHPLGRPPFRVATAEGSGELLD